jgi:Fur family ferric uptake transcriptional regulator
MKQEAIKMLHKILKDNAYSVTEARSLVFDILWNQEPQSMHEIEIKSHGKIDRASIYRTINLFERLGLVQRIIIGWKYKLELTDVFLNHHHHISCLGCGKVVSIKEDEEIEKMIGSFSVKYKITADRHQLEVQGYCEKCLKNGKIAALIPEKI